MTARRHTDLIEHLCRNMALSQSDAERLVNEVIAYFRETPGDYIRRRHRELQLQGHGNAHIFSTIKAELPSCVFPPAALSERQIRRIVYG